MTLKEIRSHFPYLGSGRIYLNHAATAPWSRCAESAVDQFKNGRVQGGDMFELTMRNISEAKELAAGMIGSRPERLAFTQNTSEGLNILAGGLPWQTGDRILLVEQEFPSNVYPFLNLKRHGVEIDFVPQENNSISIESIERLLTDKTRLLAVSWVQFLSGFRIDLKELSDLCTLKNVLLSIDAIQGIGALRMNLEETPMDFMSAGTQKWQMGPQGLAIVHVSENLQDRLRQQSLGWLSVKDSWDFFEYEIDLHDSARRYETGTYNSVGIAAYRGALQLFRDVGFDEVAKLVRENNEHLYRRCTELGFDLITPDDAVRRAGIVTFRYDNADDVQKRLLEKDIVVSARVGHIRISPHFYNTKQEIDRALEVLAE